MAEDWVDIEDQPEIRSAMIDSAIEETMTLMTKRKKS